MISEKTYKNVMNIAKSSPDGFQWNPYSWNDLQKCAGRMKKKGSLVVNFRSQKDCVFLKPSEARDEEEG